MSEDPYVELKRGLEYVEGVLSRVDSFHSLQERRLKDLEEKNRRLEAEFSQVSRERDELQGRVEDSLRVEEKRGSGEEIPRENEALEEENAILVSERAALQAEHGDCLLRFSDLEATNEDLKRELEAKDAERVDLFERFQRLQSEKLNVIRKVVDLEKDLEASQEELSLKAREKERISDDYNDVHEVLSALRDGKRIVENKLQNVLQEKTIFGTYVSRLSQRVESLESSLHAKDTLLAETTSLYENKIQEMQREWDNRLDEIRYSNDKTEDTIKTRYLDLFDEKVQELFELRQKYEETQSNLDSSERKRSELEIELRDLQSQFVRKNEVSSEKIVRLEEFIQDLRKQFEAVKESSQTSVNQLRYRLRDMREELLRKNEELDQIKLGQSLKENCNSSQSVTDQK